MEDIMSTATPQQEDLSTALDSRLLREGYGPGAWHGPDLKAALADVAPALAYWRPATGRHNVAEIALHHAYCVRNVHAQLAGTAPAPFVLEGEDWFEIATEGTLSWSNIQAIVEAQHAQLATLVADLEMGRANSPLTPSERRDLIIGITCHAIYHAGQVQLIKRLRATA
jgi:hypothetical protein